MKKSGINRHILVFYLLLCLSVIPACREKSVTSSEDSRIKDWIIGPFEKESETNPVLLPIDSTTFLCPVRNQLVYWESKDVFNPAALVRNDTLFLLPTRIFCSHHYLGKKWVLANG